MLTYENVCDEFIKNVPEAEQNLKIEYDKGFISDEDGSYIFFGMGVLESLEQFLSDDIENHKVLLKFFDFFEKMANSSDDRVQSLLMYGVLEDLGNTPATLLKSRKLMGAQTLYLSKKIETFFGRERMLELLETSKK